LELKSLLNAKCCECLPNIWQLAIGLGDGIEEFMRAAN
jgi:hypothetical protein